MKKYFINPFVLVVATVTLVTLSCSKSNNEPAPPVGPVTSDVTAFVTTSNQSSLFAQQTTPLAFSTVNNQVQTITVDTTQQFQTMDGFGYTLTGGSAQLINTLATSAKTALLEELFSTTGNAIGISYLRISIGASDLSSGVYTYNDLPAGQTDPTLQNFDISMEQINMIPVLKQIIAINPNIKILATPWTAPSWMKTNNSPKGGKLNSANYSTYADYFVKYIQAMKAQGITIDAITPQNEPLNPDNNPSMVMTSAEQADFIKNHLGPKFQAANLATKIIVYDHNVDQTVYPIDIYNDAAASAFVDGAAFHLYAGNINALASVHNLFPAKNLYFTEQYTDANGSFAGDLAWHLRNLIVGAPRNWCKNVLEWNLANDPNYGPHTPGGCTSCKGALTISGNSITRNVSYYIIAHASKFVRPGSIRVSSNIVNNLQNVAFVTPDGKKVLVVLNDNNSTQSFNIKFKDKAVTTALEPGSVATYVW